MRRICSLIAAFVGVFRVSAANAVMIYGDPTAVGDAPANHRNLSAPTGSYTSSGWQFEGTFGSGNSAYTGTPVASNYFVTADHVGAVSNFTFRGTTYPVVSGQRIGTTDLRVWKISGSFPSDGIAPLYNETVDGALSGKSLVAYGRGVAPGTLVTRTKPGNKTVYSGWTWGAVDGAMSWGANTIDRKVTSGTLGQLLAFSASSAGGPNEGTLTDKDSGGGVFVQGAGGVWKLAGINYGISPQRFNTTASATGEFKAGIFDTYALYSPNTSGAWVASSTLTASGLQESYATSISDNYSALVAAVPEPGAIALAVGSLILLAKRQRSPRGATGRASR